jgi:cell division protein FtsB
MLFFQSNKMDVWAKILARAASIDKEAAHDARRQREAAARHKKEMDELITLVLMLLVFGLVLGGVGWVVYEAMQQCAGKC